MYPTIVKKYQKIQRNVARCIPSYPSVERQQDPPALEAVLSATIMGVYRYHSFSIEHVDLSPFRLQCLQYIRHWSLTEAAAKSRDGMRPEYCKGILHASISSGPSHVICLSPPPPTPTERVLCKWNGEYAGCRGYGPLSMQAAENKCH